MSIQKRDSLGPSLCSPSSGDGACGDPQTDPWTGQRNPGVTGVKASTPLSSLSSYDHVTTQRLAGHEQDHIAASTYASSPDAGNQSGTGLAIGGPDPGRFSGPTIPEQSGAGEALR
jgi:hypothetical protein